MGGIVGDVVGGITGAEAPDYGAAIQAAQFKPWTIKSGFGSSNYDTATQTASYTLSPTLKKFRNAFYQGAMGMLPTGEQQQFANDVSSYGQGLFSQAASMNKEQAALDYYNKLQGILNPARQQQEAQLADTLFKQGRTGAATGMQGGYVNPEQFALLKAREQQNQQLGLDSYDRARAIQQQDLTAGLGYYGTGQEMRLAPYQQVNSLFGMGAGIENMGMGLMNQGMNYGATVSQAQAPMIKGMMNQAEADSAYSMMGANFLGSALQGMGGWSALGGKLFGGAGVATGGTSIPINFKPYGGV